MKKLNEKIGLIVKNNAESLRQILGVKSIKSTKDNYEYKGSMGEHLLLIIETEPVGENAKEIRITKITRDDSTFKLEIAYEMIKGDEVVKVCLDLPIARHKYDEIEKAFDDKDKTYDEFKTVFEKLVVLQGFDKLGELMVHF